MAISTRTTRTKGTVDRSSPRIEVCGASDSPLEVWVRVKDVLDPGKSRGDGIVAERYFGQFDSEVNRQDPGIKDQVGDIPLIRDRYCHDEEPDCAGCPLVHHCLHHRSQQKGEGGPSTADLFCGAGGLTLGFEQAGFDSRVAIDLDEWAMRTHAYNRPGHSGASVCADLRMWLDGHPGAEKVDVLMGGPPCQSFSTANRQRQEEDGRDELYKLFIEAIPRFSPKVLLIENVRGFEKVQPALCKGIEKHGYVVKGKKLNAREFGIPQNRARLFTIGVSESWFGDEAGAVMDRITDRIEEAVRDNERGLIEALGGLPEVEASRKRNNTAYESDDTGWTISRAADRDWNGYLDSINGGSPRPLLVFNHKGRYNNDRDIEIFSRLKPGENSAAESIADIMPYASRSHIFKDKYYRLLPDKVCKTITAHMGFDCNMYIHPTQARGLTVREAARVQGFPDNYVILGTLHSMYKQVGNAVPPPLAKVLAEAILPEVTG